MQSWTILLLLLLSSQPSINGARPRHKQANAPAGLACVSGPSSCPLFSESRMVCIIYSKYDKMLHLERNARFWLKLELI